jgi:hypothetical protein
MQLIKFALIAGACGVVWYEAVQTDHSLFPPGLAGLTGFYLIVLALFTGAFRAVSVAAIVNTVGNFVQSFLFLWTLYIFCTRGGNVVLVFRNAAVIIVAFSIPPITNWFLGIPSWSYSGEHPLWLTGFTTKRTGWSTGLALYIPLIVAYPLFLSRKRAFAYSLSLAGIIILLGGQFIAGGRSGLLASLIALAVLSILLPRTLSAMIFTALIGGGVYFSDSVYNQLRLDGLGSLSFETLNRISSYRLDDYIAAYDLFWQRPLGHGLGKGVQILIRDYQQSTDLHNVWLRLLVDGGIPLLLGCLLVVCWILKKNLENTNLHILHRIRLQRPVHALVKEEQLLLLVCLSVLLAGLSISMFEPQYPIGVFQNSAMWWGSAGTIVGIAALNQNRTQPQ